jgi:CRP-like cAMP-binding protein
MVRSDEFFGESCLAGKRPRNEAAVALNDVTVMAWSSSEIEQQVEHHPHLGIALSQYLVAQCMGLQDRIQSAVCYKTPERVIVALVQMANHLGTAMPDGTTRIPGTTHRVIAQFVGTSREIVTFQMNRLRQAGMMTYSRKHIDIYLPALLEELQQRGVTPPYAGRVKEPRSATP